MQIHREDADLTFLLVGIDANMLHGWLLSAALTAPTKKKPPA